MFEGYQDKIALERYFEAINSEDKFEVKIPIWAIRI
jgi:hypothetical protein